MNNTNIKTRTLAQGADTHQKHTRHRCTPVFACPDVPVVSFKLATNQLAYKLGKVTSNENAQN